MNPTTNQPIPVVDERTAALWQLFDAFAAAKPWCLTIDDPSAADALKTWAKAHGYAIREVHYIVERTEPYANLDVDVHDGRRIVVLDYRKLSAEEIEAGQINVKTLTRKERWGTREVAL